MKKEEFFSEANGFWLSIRPRDYVRLVKPTEFDTLIAMRARSIVGQWIERVKGASRSREDWEAGWDTRRITPRMDKGKGDNFKTPQPCYSPTRPAMEEYDLKLASLSFTSSGNVAYLMSNNRGKELWYRAELAHNVFDDKKAADNLLRRMRSSFGAQSIPSDFSTEIKEKEAICRTIGKELGIGAHHIHKVLRQAVKFESQPKKRKLEVELNIEEEVEILEEERTITSQLITIPPIITPLETQTSDSGKKHKELTEPSTNVIEEKVYEASPLPSSQPNHMSNQVIHEETPEQEIVPIGSHIEIDLPAIVISGTPPSITSEIHQDIIATEEMETPESERRSLKERAESLLRTGVMPLFPPARREWTNMQPVKICTDPIMVWPPENWEELSADSRLTAWQFTAMALEFREGVRLITNQQDVLDKYAMLALPGTSLTTCITTPRNGTTQVRLFNYNLVKDIYHGNLREQEAVQWLTAFEAARRGIPMSSKTILENIKDVPLRLKTDQDNQTPI